MNSTNLKKILLLYRPGIDDKEDSEVAEALAAMANDPELERWFKNHRAQCEAIRDKFRQIPFPKSTHASAWRPP